MKITPGGQARLVVVAAIRKRSAARRRCERERAADAGVVFACDLLRDGDPAAFGEPAVGRGLVAGDELRAQHFARAAGRPRDHPDAAAAELRRRRPERR